MLAGRVYRTHCDEYGVLVEKLTREKQRNHTRDSFLTIKPIMDWPGIYPGFLRRAAAFFAWARHGSAMLLWQPNKLIFILSTIWDSDGGEDVDYGLQGCDAV